MNFSSKDRVNQLKQLARVELDVLVIGGGITGAGIALDAAARGLQVGLVEMQDYAAGTSSRSTKLIHGGLRYLKQLEMSLVAEVGKERAIVYENGPHVTRPEWMMLPFYKGGTFGTISTRIGLRIYDFLAGVKKSERRQMLTSKVASEKEPLLKLADLKGAGLYVEYKTDDARLTLEVLKKAVELGASAVNYTKVNKLLYNGKIVNGALVTDQISGSKYEIYAKKLINATGPWLDDIRELDQSKVGKTLFLTKGVHLVFKQEKFPLEQAVYFDTTDKRMVFAIPRGNKTYVGTTDTAFGGELNNPLVSKADCTYLIAVINKMFPTLQLELHDIDSSWAGVRPLIHEAGKNPSDISRKDEIFLSDSGLYSMAGGKLTGYRKMAENVISQVVKELEKATNQTYPHSNTVDLPISGGDLGGGEGFERFMREKLKYYAPLEIDERVIKKLISIYGSNIDTLLGIYVKDKASITAMGFDPMLYARVKYAIEYEQAYKPVDYFLRRTSDLYFDVDHVFRVKETVIKIMDDELQWTENERKVYSKELEQRLAEARLEM